MATFRNFWKLTRWARALRFWLFVLLALGAWLGFGEARAQSLPNPCATTEANCSVDIAYQACKAEEAQWEPLGPAEGPERRLDTECFQSPGPQVWQMRTCERTFSGNCRAGSYSTFVYRYTSGCPAGQEWFGGVFNRCSSTCESRPQLVSIANPKSGSVECSDGCSRTWHANGDDFSSTASYTGGRCEGTRNDCDALTGGNYFWNPIFGMCEPVVPECPEGQVVKQGVCVVNDFCPIGQIMNGQNQCVEEKGDCPAGSERSLEGMCVDLEDDEGNKLCPDGQARGSDGTCKFDEDGDGEPDEDEGMFSGGDDCRVPPTCSGDNIMCGQARIQWRIDCNTRRNQKISGGACGQASMPVCVGESCDLMQYAQLMQAWKTACAVERLADGMLSEGSGPGGPGQGDGDGKDGDFDPYAAGIEDADGLDDDGADPDDIFTDESANNDGAGGVPGGTGELDTSGLGYSRGCPSLPSVSFMGQTIDFGLVGGSVLCDWMQLGGVFVLIISALISVRILAGGVAV